MSKKKRRQYFIKQKLGGLALLLVALLSIKIDGEATFAIFAIPFGLHLIFTKKMVFTLDYFFRVQEEENRKS